MSREKRKAPARAPSPARKKQKIADIEDAVPGHDDVVPALREKLLTWFDAEHRTLPWRKSPPNRVGDVEEEDRGYAVWVSEIMCVFGGKVIC